MELCKRLVQSLHLCGLWPWVVVLLAISRFYATTSACNPNCIPISILLTLMLPLLHNLCRSWSQNKQIRQTCHKHGHDGRQRNPSALLFQQPHRTCILSDGRDLLTRPCQREYDRESGLEGEVGREDGLLEGAEGGAWEGLEGKRTGEERLEEVRA